MTFASMRRFACSAAFVAMATTFSAPAPASAQGDLLVAPTRVILDGRRGTEVVLSNIGSEEATYRIGLELRRMMENGRLVPVEKPDANGTASLKRRWRLTSPAWSKAKKARNWP